MPKGVLTARGPSRVPRATYRFQFNEHFPLGKGIELVPYLHDLGVSHVYSSPLFAACPHSVHGYDACDFARLNPELGAEIDLGELADALHARGMGLVLDIVPNHMGIGCRENRWWWDVLACGPHSDFAKYFDIDWNSPDPWLRGKVLAPVLGDRYQSILKSGQLKLESDQNRPVLRYADHYFPINAPSWKAANAGIEELNSNADALDALIEQQFYRLAYYRRGDRELNYRRFFSISSLAGLRIEDEEVFCAVMAKVRDWIERGWIDGLRVDHPDGLRNPEQFLQRLKALAPGAWIVVEKILQPEELLPNSWPVAGTTGYDFLNYAGGLCIDPAGEKALAEFYVEVTGNGSAYSKVAVENKRRVVRTILAAELARLADLLARVAARHWNCRDFSRMELGEALVEFIANFPVYRTYICPENNFISPADTEAIAQTVDRVARERKDLSADLFGLIKDVLTLKSRGDLEDEFAVRFQQLSAPAMAKGIEDNSFYRYNRFIALNEVGCDPGRFSVSREQFHEFCRRQQKGWPETMLASSTHDTKREEDVRARLSVLSEIPMEWRQTVRQWSAINARHWKNAEPDSNAEYYFYQTVAGAWPLSTERALACMEKSVREAGEHTSWTDVNEPYESRLREFVSGALKDAEFLREVGAFVDAILEPACVNSLALTLLKLCAPGIPDIYQGTELWGLSLVDPDNRRPVDFDLRRELLARAAKMSAEEAWKERNSGLPKLWLIRRVLKFREKRPGLFDARAGYEALEVNGPKKDNVVAFKRGDGLIAIVPRLIMSLHKSPLDAIISPPEGRWHNQLTDELIQDRTISVAHLLRKFPVALLTTD